MNNSNFEFIDSNGSLLHACESLAETSVLAIDTEFQRETTYYPIPALVQLYAGDEVLLIDPTQIDNFAPLAEIFSDKNIVKVMHSCVEDLEVFHQLRAGLPGPLFDTQIAAAMCELGFSVSYSRLVEEVTGTQLDKSETRSDWLQRPLTPSQFQYAVDDVLWLPALYEHLSSTLEAKQRDRWCREECEQLLVDGGQATVPDQAYLRFKSAWRLAPKQLASLRTLAAWREREAQQSNVPRSRILKDAALFELVETRPSTTSQLISIQGIGNYTLRKYGEQLLEIIGMDSSDKQQGLITFPDKKSHAYRSVLKVMQKVVREVAEAQNLPPELLGRKRDLEDYISNKETSIISSSWRQQLIADQLDQALLASNL